MVDKGRRAGGRLASRTPRATPNLSFDTGAQYFTARDAGFQSVVEDLEKEGVVSEWKGRIRSMPWGTSTAAPLSSKTPTKRFVGVPTNNDVPAAIMRQLTALHGKQHAGSGPSLRVFYEHEISSIQANLTAKATDASSDDAKAADSSQSVSYKATFKLGAAADMLSKEDFDIVVVTAPPSQTARLLNEAAPQMAATANTVNMAGCWCGMFAFDKPLELPFDGAFVNPQGSADHKDAGGSHAHSVAQPTTLETPPFSWVCRNTSKTGRPGEKDCWIVHSTPSFFDEYSEEAPNAAADLLLAEFDKIRSAFGLSTAVAPIHKTAHRWRYSFPTNSLRDSTGVDSPFLWDPTLRIGVCGDWCGSSRVEGAFLSGSRLADVVAGIVEQQQPPASL